jgi:glutathione S-transferase
MDSETLDRPVVSAFVRVPDFAKGRVRDLRVRWAYEEIGADYDTHLLDAMQPRGADYVAWQPFDQVPALRDGGIEMFESGAILLHIAEKHEALLPRDEQARCSAVSWLFAALNSVEPALMMEVMFALFHADKPWSGEALETVKPFARQRLKRVADALGNREWLAGEFSIADIAMSTVINIDMAGLVEEQPALAAYRERAFARPAYKRALQAQLSDFQASPAPDEIRA